MNSEWNCKSIIWSFLMNNCFDDQYFFNVIGHFIIDYATLFLEIALQYNHAILWLNLLKDQCVYAKTGVNLFK